MRINDIPKGDRPPYAQFDEVGICYSGPILSEPELRQDPHDLEKTVLVVPIRAADGFPCDIWMRSPQMRSEFIASVAAVGEEEVVPGGHLSVTFVRLENRTKIYSVVYTAPQVPCPRLAWVMSQDSTGARLFSEPIYSREYED